MINLRKVIERLLNDDALPKTLAALRAGKVFDYDSFSAILDFRPEEIGISEDNAKIIILTDRADSRFVHPYKIISAGLGYSRSHILFDVDVEGQTTTLSASDRPYVDCI